MASDIIERSKASA